MADIKKNAKSGNMVRWLGERLGGGAARSSLSSAE